MTMSKWKTISLIFALVLALAIVLLTVIRVPESELGPLVSLQTYQDADAPLVAPEIDPRFLKFSAFDRATLTPALEWESPIGSGALVAVTKPFLAPVGAAGEQHLGVDLESFGASESVRAVANGLVVFSAKADPEWGNVLVIAHRDAQGTLCQSIYAHLDEVRLNRGVPVVRGQVVGTMSNKTPSFHFALRTGDNTAPGPKSAVFQGPYVDPLVQLMKPSEVPPHPEVLGLVKSSEHQSADPFSTFEIKGAERLAEIMAAPEPPPAKE